MHSSRFLDLLSVRSSDVIPLCLQRNHTELLCCIFLGIMTFWMEKIYIVTSTSPDPITVISVRISATALTPSEVISSVFVVISAA